MSTFTPSHVRYIKLGQKDAWAVASLDGGTLQMGHAAIPHELCQRGAWAEVTAGFEAAGLGGAKTSFTRELRDFYTLGPECLWVTFARGYLWWAFAEPDVTWLGGDGIGHGYRQRKVLGAWSNMDLTGHPLRFNELSSRLTKVAAYRQTICEVSEIDHLLRRLRGEEAPVLAMASRAKAQMLLAAEKMIADLHWADFETMVDLIFARNGWQRVSELGGRQKDLDLEVYEPVIGCRGFVQVKSQANQAVLDQNLERYEAGGGFDHMFFVCHSPKGDLKAPDRPDVHVWVRERLADMALKAGLYDWLLQRSS